jgi:2-(1,2-epoxy-1,2-dihydrophenyl)acetyl-CoA isomerase
MPTESVKFERRGAVATITLNRPEQANSLDLPMAQEFFAAAAKCGDAAVRAVVLSGAGRNFCFGGDLRSMAVNGVVKREYLRELTHFLHAGISLLVRMSAPLLAAVNGTAAGAGIGLMAMADLAYCGSSSKFKLAYGGVGLTPDAGASFLLPHAIGARRTMELLLLNRTLTAAEALSWGLVNGIHEDAQVFDATLAIAERIAAGPAEAFGRTKQLVGQALAGLESQMALESEAVATQAQSSEGREGISAFLDKRSPVFVPATPET